jgi:tetratricopeptide (TPR) repeat protein
MGNTFDNMGDSRLALQYYQKAVALRPRTRSIGGCWPSFPLPRDPAARRGAAGRPQVLALAPAQAESYDLMGSVLLQLNDPLGRNDSCIRHCEKMLSLQPYIFI